MPTAHGYEYHKRSPRTPGQDRFIRVIRTGSIVRARTGVRGGADHLSVTRCDSVYAALAYVTAQVDAADRNGYVQAYFCDIADSDDTPDDRAQLAEQLFCDTWADAMAVNIDADGALPRHYWALFSDLEANQGRDVGCVGLATRLMTAPHATSPAGPSGGDRLVGQVVNLPRLQNCTPGHNAQVADASHVTTVRLGVIEPNCVHGTPACDPCNQRIAELLVYFMRDFAPAATSLAQREAMVQAAGRLVRTNTTPQPA